MKIIYCGDVVGRAGRDAVLTNIKPMRERFKADIIIVNVENAAHGFGVTPGIAKEFLESGADVLTTGNHVWQQRDIIPFLNENKLCKLVTAYGDNVLSETCAVFPREVHRFKTHEEETLMPCCPAVIDLLREEEPQTGIKREFLLKNGF